ncbi:MAG: hypothetical protein JOZ83_12260, partial [Silvibacterium sp.]|nr:hypothetical protein [Silvibacterium sp.]
MGSVHFRFCVALASLSVLLSTAAAQPTNSGSHGNGSNGQNQSDTSDRRYYSNSDNHVVNAGRQPLRQSDGHPVETYGGHNPHGSSDAPEIAAGAAAAGGIITALIIHEEHTPEHLGKEGPQVPKQFDMSGFAIKGLVGPNWPVVLDFIVDSPGAAQVDIVTGDKHHFRAT